MESKISTGLSTSAVAGVASIRQARGPLRVAQDVGPLNFPVSSRYLETFARDVGYSFMPIGLAAFGRNLGRSLSLSKPKGFQPPALPSLMSVGRRCDA